MLVTVWITTYNHAAFIGQAIESVLNQRTNFDYEILIGEDFSKDNTRDIVKTYKKEYPDKIRLCLPDRNLGMHEMFKASYALCKGKYIAWLDGDDYWTDPDKLQKQVNFLEANSDFVMCCHKIEISDEINKITFQYPDFGSDTDTDIKEAHLVDLNNFIYTPSVTHRNVLSNTLPSWFYDFPFPDLGFYFLLLQHGRIKFHQDLMAVYRIHKSGAYQGESLYNNYSKYVKFFELILHHGLTSLQKKIHSIICNRCLYLLNQDLKKNNIPSANEHLRLIRQYNFAGLADQKKHLVKALLLLIVRNPIDVVRLLWKTSIIG